MPDSGQKAHTTPVRKSGRQRVPNKKYTNDAFEGLDIFNSDSERDHEVLHQLQDSKNDDDFPEDSLDVNEDEDSLAEGVSDGSVIHTPEEEYENAPSYASSDAEERNLPGTLKKHKGKPRDYVSTHDANIRSRGMPENILKADHERSRVKLFSGPGIEDILHVVKSRDQWAADPILPRRQKLRYQVSHTDQKRQMEATVGWDWYYSEGGRELFAKIQKVQILSMDEGMGYLPETTNDNLRFLMGPYGRQNVFTLGMSQSLDIEEAWRITSGSSEPNSKGPPSCKRRRRGWMLNVGTRVRCLDWAPNHHGATQYLALAIAKASTSPRAATPVEAPAFTPSRPTPSSVQIWAFNTSDDSNGYTHQPELRQVLCTEWGDATQLKWCPVPRANRDEDALGKTFVGLLAGVWGDGSGRVLDVQLQRVQGAITTYCKFHHDQSLKVRGKVTPIFK